MVGLHQLLPIGLKYTYNVEIFYKNIVTLNSYSLSLHLHTDLLKIVGTNSIALPIFRSLTTRSLSHLLYADDTLIFCAADRDQALHLNLTLHLFDALSGLHINKLKSVIYPVNEVPNLEELADILGCSTGTFLQLIWDTHWVQNTMPQLYGVGLSRNLREDLAPCKCNIFQWVVSLLLSIMYLILSPHYMSLHLKHKEVLNKLDKIRRNLFWQGNNTDYMFHLVKWDMVILPKHHGRWVSKIWQLTTSV